MPRKPEFRLIDARQSLVTAGAVTVIVRALPATGDEDTDADRTLVLRFLNDYHARLEGLLARRTSEAPPQPTPPAAKAENAGLTPGASAGSGAPERPEPGSVPHGRGGPVQERESAISDVVSQAESAGRPPELS